MAGQKSTITGGGQRTGADAPSALREFVEGFPTAVRRAPGGHRLRNAVCTHGDCLLHGYELRTGQSRAAYEGSLF